MTARAAVMRDVAVKLAELNYPAVLASAIVVAAIFGFCVYKIWNRDDLGPLKGFLLAGAVGFGLILPVLLVDAYNTATSDCVALGESSHIVKRLRFASDHCASVVACNRDFPIQGDPPRQHCTAKSIL